MSLSTLLITLLALLLFGYFVGRKRSLQVAKRENQSLHSLPQYYGYLVVLWAGIPTLLLLMFWSSLESTVITDLTVQQLPQEIQQLPADELGLLLNEIIYLAESGQTSEDAAKQLGATRYQALQQQSGQVQVIILAILGLLGFYLGLSRIKPELRARNQVEKMIRWIMIGCASIAILTTIGIIFSVAFEAILFFKAVPMTEFMFGTHWSPQQAIREDQVGGSGSFGAVPLFVGTLLISFIALIVAVPLGLMSAIYLSEYATARFRSIAKPMLEILAGIPTVVYGFFAALTVAPWIREVGESFGLNPASESALAAGLVMGVMIIPFVSSLSDDVINAVPQAMRDGSYGMGATHSETIRQVVIPAALPGIVGGVLLAASRAIGETMIVVMAAGLSANLTINPLEAVTTVTVQIVTLLTGDQEFDSPKTLAAFALGLGLFVTTLVLNVISLHVVRKYREQYE